MPRPAAPRRAGSGLRDHLAVPLGGEGKRIGVDRGHDLGEDPAGLVLADPQVLSSLDRDQHGVRNTRETLGRGIRSEIVVELGNDHDHLPAVCGPGGHLGVGGAVEGR